jgi:lysophospholipid acyltransferase (LPLAT)-like uncharacterized protein
LEGERAVAASELKALSWSDRLLVALGYRLLQLWARTLRFQLEDRSAFVTRSIHAPVIGAVFHNRLLLLPYVTRLFVPKRRPVALVSASRDGAILSAFVKHYNVDVARGSSSRKGVAAMLQLADVLAAGRDVVITPDGPRGPAYEIGGGIVFLAQKSGAPVLPMNIEYSSFWRLKSWDRFILPKPFSTVRFTFGALHHVPATVSDAEFEAERLRLQNAMMEIVQTR